MRRFALFFTIAISLVLLCAYHLGHRLLGGSAFLAEHPLGVWSVLGVFVAFVVLGPMLSRLLPPRFSGRFYGMRWIVNMAMAVFFSMLFYTFSVDLLIYALAFFVDPATVVTLHDWSLAAIALLVILTLIVGALQALTPKIYRVEVPIAKLPPAFDGFKIAQISDLHIGEMIGKKYVDAVVAKTNSLAPDLVAMTGDIIDGSLELIAPVAQRLAALRARDGVFFVTGNHEYYWDLAGSIRAIASTGAKMLTNEHVKISRAGEEIAVAGVPDISIGATSNPEKSIRGLPQEIVKILLAHQPASHRGAAAAGFDLQLSGHTHGGQFFPWSLVVRLFQHYNKGLIRHGALWIYVNRGTATWGPRMRFGIPPEITLLTLRRAALA